MNKIFCIFLLVCMSHAIWADTAQDGETSQHVLNWVNGGTTVCNAIETAANFVAKSAEEATTLQEIQKMRDYQKTYAEQYKNDKHYGEILQHKIDKKQQEVDNTTGKNTKVLENRKTEMAEINARIAAYEKNASALKEAEGKVSNLDAKMNLFNKMGGALKTTQKMGKTLENVSKIAKGLGYVGTGLGIAMDCFKSMGEVVDGLRTDNGDLIVKGVLRAVLAIGLGVGLLVLAEAYPVVGAVLLGCGLLYLGYWGIEQMANHLWPGIGKGMADLRKGLDKMMEDLYESLLDLAVDVITYLPKNSEQIKARVVSLADKMQKLLDELNQGEPLESEFDPSLIDDVEYDPETPDVNDGAYSPVQLDKFYFR